LVLVWASTISQARDANPRRYDCAAQGPQKAEEESMSAPRIAWHLFTGLPWMPFGIGAVAGAIAAFVVAPLLFGCSSTKAMMPVAERTLTAVTIASTASMDQIFDARETDGQTCASSPDTKAYDECIAAVNARWAPVWVAMDTIEAVDRSALKGSPDMASVLKAYCSMRSSVAAKVNPPNIGCEGS
jgi:hypothetical protein